MEVVSDILGNGKEVVGRGTRSNTATANKKSYGKSPRLYTQCREYACSMNGGTAMHQETWKKMDSLHL